MCAINLWIMSIQWFGSTAKKMPIRVVTAFRKGCHSTGTQHMRHVSSSLASPKVCHQACAHNTCLSQRFISDANVVVVQQALLKCVRITAKSQRMKHFISDWWGIGVSSFFTSTSLMMLHANGGWPLLIIQMILETILISLPSLQLVSIWDVTALMADTPFGRGCIMMINERPHALWAYSFESLLVNEAYSFGWGSTPCVCQVLLVTFFRGLPQGIAFDLWLERSFDIVNYRILYMLVTFEIHTLYTNCFSLGVSCLLSVWHQCLITQWVVLVSLIVMY